MLDRYGRNINYLRVSVTDRCNLRCQYCMPADGVKNIGHAGILSLEEIARMVRIGAELGIRKVRLTGGEPLIRKNLNQLVSYINEMDMIDDIALTTNGILFAPLAEKLKAAGLNRVNFSLDSLNEGKYSYITRNGDLHKVVQGIEKALELKLHPIKINVVVIKGFNDDELLDFADLAYNYPLHIRFIEFMPIGDLLFWNPKRMMSVAEIKQVIQKKYPLGEEYALKGNGPARYYSIESGQGSLGFISPMSNHFCAKCNRIRLTAEGKLRGCLHDQSEINLKTFLSQGASDEELKDLFMKAIRSKPNQHHMDTGWGEENHRKMYQIGG
ncbi:Molybdenum cofactor biosynthesis protein A [Syntrophomonas zehnderi OL-4]|uniref:GTP 3',8-cyclase n=1 Tax=Syntrophomonas zehnderi OL-4 TaxID=690567 RepID=A0A0E3W3L2_9FIRM|nr:GTP 3',8-cyclase MoaA [Syntrophomonas zehnderi]CFX90608.1 Molybdenum cofactor biosynthesis protein A [Syntrophomonas zehnderi OL-4]